MSQKTLAVFQAPGTAGSTNNLNFADNASRETPAASLNVSIQQQ